MQRRLATSTNSRPENTTGADRARGLLIIQAVPTSVSADEPSADRHRKTVLKSARLAVRSADCDRIAS
jgi:hypothetical protein